MIFRRRERNSSLRMFRTRYSFHSSPFSSSYFPFPYFLQSLTSCDERLFQDTVPFLFFSFLFLSLSKKNFIRIHWDKTPDVTGYVERSNKGLLRNDPTTSLDHSLPSPPLFNDRITFHGIPPPDR